MNTEISIDGSKFLINGKPTYKDIEYQGKTLEGLLFNSRMVQAIYDDECPETAKNWVYPDTHVWDVERNTNEFCEALKEYRKHGLLAVTVGLQGGGPIYKPEIFDKYINSAFTPDGNFKESYFKRLLKVLDAADKLGMVVIVNYFYFRQAWKTENDKTIFHIAEKVTDWLLKTGYKNILVDIMNEACTKFWKKDYASPENVHKIIETVKSVALNGRKLYTGVSIPGGEHMPSEKWLKAEDITLPHGNTLKPEGLKMKINKLREMDAFKERPRPLLINEDSVFLDNFEASVSQYASWGFYHQGYGSNYKDAIDWGEFKREEEYEKLSGFQTPPINWSINDKFKKDFFNKLKEVTKGE